jgi:hypothetical protein
MDALSLDNAESSSNRAMTGDIDEDISHNLDVIPAKAGIHFALRGRSTWIPAFAGMTSSAHCFLSKWRILAPGANPG